MRSISRSSSIELSTIPIGTFSTLNAAIRTRRSGSGRTTRTARQAQQRRRFAQSRHERERDDDEVEDVPARAEELQRLAGTTRSAARAPSVKRCDSTIRPIGWRPAGKKVAVDNLSRTPVRNSR